MRSLTVLLLSLFAVGCLDTEEPATGETSADVTLSYSTTLAFTNPKLVILARVERLQNAADDMRALAAASKAPMYSTWTVIQQYRSFADFATSSATTLDQLAASTYAIAELYEIVTMALAEQNRLDMQDQLARMKAIAEQKEAMQTQLQKLRAAATTLIDTCDDE